MPVILLDRLPLPSLRAYTIISVGLLSCSVYYAVQVTSDPNWKVNSTTSGSNLEPNENESDEIVLPPSAIFHHNETVGYHLSQLVTFMIQEPLCIWVSALNVLHLLTCADDWSSIVIYVFTAKFELYRFTKANNVIAHPIPSTCQ